jgi:hypothetical protein
LSTPDGEVIAVEQSSGHPYVDFTNSTWDTWQTVVVSAVDDGDVEYFHRSSVFHNVDDAVTQDTNYLDVGMPRVITNIIDDDSVGVMIIPSDGSTDVSEAGDTDTYEVVLTKSPATGKFVSVTLDNTLGQVTGVNDNPPGGNVLTFTSTDWNVRQTVRVTAVDDDFVEGPHRAYIPHLLDTDDEGLIDLPTGTLLVYALPERVSITDDDYQPAPPNTSTFSASYSGDPERPIVRWGEAYGATKYNIWMINLETQELVAADRNLPTNSFTPEADLEHARHRVWVQAGNANGWGAWSAPFDFDCGPACVVPDPPSGLEAINTDTAFPTIQWDEDPEADYYAIWYIKRDTQTVISGADHLTEPSYTHPDGLDEGNYRFWVRAANAAGSSAFAGPCDFTIDIPPSSSLPAYRGAFFPRGNRPSGATATSQPEARVSPARTKMDLDPLEADPIRADVALSTLGGDGVSAVTGQSRQTPRARTRFDTVEDLGLLRSHEPKDRSNDDRELTDQVLIAWPGKAWWLFG